MKASHPIRRIGRWAFRILPQPLAVRLRSIKDRIFYHDGPRAYFKDIYLNNKWNSEESISGPGSEIETTAELRKALPVFMKAKDIGSLLDIPCGDLHWIVDCLPDDVAYIGGDIVEELIAKNREKHANVGTFITIDLIRDTLPAADMLLVRDCLIHLPNDLAQEALRNIARGSFRFVALTTYNLVDINEHIQIGGFRRTNLTVPPFDLPPPDFELEEGYEAEYGRILGVWRREVLADAVLTN